MRRRPFHRLTTTFFVAFALLFSQLALAAYVCPAQAEAAAMVEMMACGEPCDGMHEGQPVPCHQHSAGAAQSYDAVKLPVASLPMIVQVLILPMIVQVLILQAVAAVAIPVAASPEAQPQPDPPFLSTLRLRV